MRRQPPINLRDLLDFKTDRTPIALDDVESITELVIAGTAAQVRPWLHRVGQRFNQVCGGVFMLIGAALPLR